jgi:hypothetical protein
MWPTRFWPDRFWNPRYWAKVGATPPTPAGIVDADVTLVLTLTENTRLFGGLLKDNQVVVTLEDNVRVTL